MSFDKRRLLPAEGMMSRLGTLVTLAMLTVVVTSTVGRAQTDNRREVEELKQRLERVEAELQRLRRQAGLVPEDAAKHRLIPIVESPTMQLLYSTKKKVFAARLVILNLTPKPVEVTKENIVLEVDGKPKTQAVPKNEQYQSIQMGARHMRLRDLQSPARLKIAAGRSASAWVLFSGLDDQIRLPKLVLKVTGGEYKGQVDINESQRSLLDVEVERIGPRRSLALLTVHGQLNPVNAGILVDELDGMIEKKVVRAVIRWSPDSPPLHSNLSSWLQRSALQAGKDTTSSNSGFPTFPSSLRELHLANLPGGQTYSTSGVVRIHKTDVDAVSAALHSAYGKLPRNELLPEILGGHPLTRVAALAIGGGRLPPEHIPRLLEFADNEDPQIQRAALVAMRHFGQPEVVAKLSEYARRNVAPLSDAAVESLASSRFASAHDALLELLNNEPPESKGRMFAVIARFPRPIWSDLLFEFASDSRQDLRSSAIAALIQVGHPKLVTVLRQAIEGSDRKLQEQAFNALSSRTDPESEELALAFALDQLAGTNTPPSRLLSQITSLVVRTKDVRAIPLLKKRLAQMSNSNDRGRILATLAQVGDERMVKFLVEQYERFGDDERRAILNATRQLQSSAFRELASKALKSSDSSLISSATQGLRDDGSPEAVKMLAEALDKSPHRNAWSAVANALATVASPAAKQALLRARGSSNQNKRDQAMSALRNIRQRSPGYNHFSQGDRHRRDKKFDDALAQYNIAIEVDPELVEAYSGRGAVYYRQNKFAEAAKDFARAAELDPFDFNAMTGQALVMVAQNGDLNGALKVLADARAKLPNNTNIKMAEARVLGRSIGYLQANKTLKSEMKLEELQQKTIAAITAAAKRVPKKTVLKDEPDFAAVKELSEFKKLVDGGEGATPRPTSPE